MADAPNSAEIALKNSLTIKHGGFEYVFKIPSIGDKLEILGKAAKIRKNCDPDGTGITLGYDPSTVIFTDKLATFMVLVGETSAPWVYSPDLAGHPIKDMAKWPDDVPISEVVDQFNEELEAFRGKRV